MHIYGGSDGKESACNSRDSVSIPGLGRSSILAWRIPTDRGASWATIHGIPKIKTQLSNQHFHFFIDECIRYETFFLRVCVCVCARTCVYFSTFWPPFLNSLHPQTSGITHCHLYNPVLSLPDSLICPFCIS